MKYKISHKDFSFAVVASILTGRTFAQKELNTFAKFVAPKDGLCQMMADRESKWIPWLLVQFPFLAQIDISTITDKTAITWFEKENFYFGHGKFTIRAVHPEY